MRTHKESIGILSHNYVWLLWATTDAISRTHVYCPNTAAQTSSPYDQNTLWHAYHMTIKIAVYR